MKIGLICEGQTDFVCIREFVSSALCRVGISVEFVAVQPDVDSTRPQGGWTGLVTWLINNPPRSQIPTYFGGGLFAGSNSAKVVDCMVIQMDSDILGNPDLGNFMLDRFGLVLSNPGDPDSRANEIRRLLEASAQLSQCADADRNRHVLVAAVENTETWCFAAFRAVAYNPETLSPNEVVQKFMTVLNRSESRHHVVSFVSANKDIGRRESYCRKHRSGANRVKASCTQFDRLCSELECLAG